VALRLEIRHEATVEFEEAVAYYALISADLGIRFREAVSAMFTTLQATPLLYPAATAQLRKAYIGTFPYCIYYCVKGDTVSVVAVHHTSRNPKRWQRRLRK